MATTISAHLTRLQQTAAATLLLMLVQLGMGIGILSHVKGLRDAHGGIGYLMFLCSLVAVFFAFKYSREDASAKGMFGHAISIPLLAVVQIGLAEMAGKGGEGLKWAHVVVGVLLLVDAMGLFAMARKRSGKSL